VAREIKMAGFGNVDFVIADLAENTGQVREFVSVEMQAVDITGSVIPAYEAIVGNTSDIEGRLSYGINWANVRKRYVSQLIAKGFYHHHWGTRIVAVLQAPLYERLRQDIQFDELDPATGSNTIIFLLYDFIEDGEREGVFRLRFQRAVGTSHNSLMMASMYRQVPSKEDFCQRILAGLRS
jgi:hypothetical protein